MKEDKVISEVLGGESALAPSDVCNKQFKSAKVGGYNRQEVDRFLERVANILESHIVQVRDLKGRNEELHEELVQYRRSEATLRTALVSARELGDDVMDAAERKADAMIEEARLKKKMIELEIAKLPEKLAGDIKALESQRQQLKSGLMSVLQTHQDLLSALIPDNEPACQTGPFDIEKSRDQEDDADEEPESVEGVGPLEDDLIQNEEESSSLGDDSEESVF